MLVGQEASPSSLTITLFSILWVIVALILSWYIFRTGRFRTSTVLRNAFYVDKSYELMQVKARSASDRAVTYIEHKFIDRGIHGLAYLQVIFAHIVSWIDRIFVDGTVNSIARLTGFGGKITRSFHGGNIQLYIFWAVFAIIIFIIWTLN